MLGPRAPSQVCLAPKPKAAYRAACDVAAANKPFRVTVGRRHAVMGGGRGTRKGGPLSQSDCQHLPWYLCCTRPDGTETEPICNLDPLKEALPAHPRRYSIGIILQRELTLTHLLPWVLQINGSGKEEKGVERRERSTKTTPTAGRDN